MRPKPIHLEGFGLRSWQPHEAGLYLELRDPLIFALTTEAEDLDETTCRDNIEAALDDPCLAPFAIVESGDAPVGNLAVLRKGAMVEISYWIAPLARGRGWGAAALAASTHWAFETWPVDLAQLEILEQNEASIATARAAGYARHGFHLESACGGPALLYRMSRTG